MEETSDSFQDLEGQTDQPRPITNNEVSDENHGQDEPGDSSEYSDTDDDEDEEGVHGDSNQNLARTYEQQAKEFKDQATHIKAQLDRQMDTFASQGPDNDNADARNRFYRQFRHDMAPPKAQIVKYLSVWQWNILYYIADEKQSDRPGISTTDLAKIIVERDVEKKNCIHYAVSDGFGPEITIRLLQHTTEETLGHQDNKGLTPLQYAVEYERCLPEREEMVKALIKRSDVAFDLRSGKPEELSVYQHHVRSREKHETGAMSRKDDAKNSKRLSEQPNRMGFEMREGAADSKIPGGSESNNMDTLQLPAGSKRYARDQNQFGRPLTRTRTGSQKPPNQKKVSSRKRPKLPKPSEDVADRILKELKLHYLRTALCQENHWQYGQRGSCRNPNTTIQFLDFTKSYESLKFDKVLQHVEFRQMIVKSPPVKRPDWTDSEGRAGVGRKDVYYFFRWLSKKKAVENIIHLIVEDGHGIPHSDEAIEESLKDFNIEILDWRKPDLDLTTLQIACRNSDLREVHLWWDGNNAVLRACSEPDGLVKITTLQVIHLHETTKNVESSHRTKARIESFEARIRDHRAKVLQPLVCHHYEAYEQSLSRAEGQGPTEKPEQRAKIDSYQWLSVMDRFADGIASLEPLECFQGEDDYLKHPSLPDEMRKDVKVALIDDGVNFMHKSLAENMYGGKSFDREYDDGYRPGPREPFHGSATGHGTCMAYMIRRAVEYAVARKFDIISISWTVQLQKDEKHDNSADINRLENAISLATTNGILVFCSAPDIGRASKETLESYYPFGCKRSSTDLFKIGAAKADGVSFAWMGHDETVNYILPGHKVAPRETDNLPEEDDTPKAGSSVATALASGLAALIIHCVRLAAIYNIYTNKGDGLYVSEASVRAIKRFPAMKQALAYLCPNNDEKQTSDRNLRVENFFKRPGDIMDNKDVTEEDKWKEVVNIARDLVSYKTITQTTT
ncbi:hypothetical protein FG05_30350 [Fusarium graminearum]|nr:hypothetical protein FG05_30350 [Fusarium graminearum]